jgi:hypothetical protein
LPADLKENEKMREEVFMVKELRVLGFEDIFNEGVAGLSYPEDDRISSKNIDINKYLRGIIEPTTRD